MSTQAAASHILAHKENYSTAMVKKAVFAKNFAHRHDDGGFLLPFFDSHNTSVSGGAGYSGGQESGVLYGGGERNRSGKYVTLLPAKDEDAFQEWFQRYAISHQLDPNPDAREHYYDYRGYWNANRANPDFEVTISSNHFPDTWKTPGHPTFSVDSIYAKDAPELAGRWVNGEYVKPGMLDSNMMKLRQRYAESSFRDDLTSKAGAIGRYQIMPITYKEYVNKTGKTGDLLDPVFNEQLRDWYMDSLGRYNAVKRGNPSDLVREYRRYAAYNMGPGALNKALTKAEGSGVDIDNSLDWIAYLPKETRDYVNFIVGNQDVADTSKTAAQFNAAYSRMLKKALGGPILRQYPDGGRIPVFSPLADFRASQRNVRPVFGGFGGGDFGGAGYGTSFDVSLDPALVTQYVRNTPIPAERSFSDAYSAARNAGLKFFDFNGQRYTTDYDPNAKLGPRQMEAYPALNIREVLDENKTPIRDSTRIEPYVGQIPGVHRRDFGGFVQRLNKAYGGDRQKIMAALSRAKEGLRK